MTDRLLTTSRRGVLLGSAALAAGCVSGAGRDWVNGARTVPSVQRVLDGWVADGRLSGAAVGVRGGDGPVTYVQAGRLDHDSTTPPVDHETLFRIYSMTKPVTGVCAALLIEDGRLTLDTPVARLVPELANMRVAVDPEKGLESRPAQNIMTVRHLLTHTSGLSYHIMGDGPVQMAYRRAGIFPITGYNLTPKPEIDAPQVRDLDEMARRLAGIPLLFEPGTQFHYSCGLDVLGLVIQRASGMAFPDFMRRRLLDPIGMRDTVWRLRQGDERRLMQLYEYGGETRVVRDDRLHSAWAEPITLYPGGAGLMSTTQDYLALMTTLLDDGRAGRVRVMAPETARMVRSNIMPPAVPQEAGRFGFGGSVNAETGEYGWGGAAGTIAWADPTRRLAVVGMVQHFNQTIDVKGDLRAALTSDLT